MKILFFGTSDAKGRNELIHDFHFLQYYLRKCGHKLLFIEKQNFKDIREEINKFKPDVIVTVGIISSILILLKKLRIIKIPIIHHWNDDYHKCGGFGGKFLRKITEHWIVKNSDLNITCSKFREKKGKKMNSNIKYIPHGVIEDFDKINKSRELKGETKVVYGGEISKRKGMDKVIRAARENPNIEIYLFGGNIKSGMKKIMKNKTENVHLMGRVPHKELIGYYKQADILILATDNDSTLKMFEYIKAGKPILALNNQVNYVLEHKKTAYLTNNLAEGLEELANNKELREKISENLKEYRIYNWKEISEMYLNEIKNFLDEKEN